MARLRNVRSEIGRSVSGSRMVNCNHPNSSGYCSTLDSESPYVFRPMLDRSTYSFSSSGQELFVSTQMISCFMQTLFQIILSPAEVLTQPKVRQLMFKLVEFIH